MAAKSTGIDMEQNEHPMYNKITNSDFVKYQHNNLESSVTVPSLQSATSNY